MLVILSMLYGNMSMSERREISHETLGKRTSVRWFLMYQGGNSLREIRS